MTANSRYFWLGAVSTVGVYCAYQAVMSLRLEARVRRVDVMSMIGVVFVVIAAGFIVVTAIEMLSGQNAR
jgi:hypothetical protein